VVGLLMAQEKTLGFEIVREREHIALQRANPDGTVTPLTTPNHSTIKSWTLRTICRQSDSPREDFLSAYDKA
jgi:predicted RNA binding protein YcfA (HicA-like mRNA interferase family)